MKESEYNEIDVEKTINQAKKTESKRKLLQREYLLYIRIYVYYLEKKVLEQAELRLFQEIDDVEESIDAEHKIVLMLKNNFHILLSNQGKWKEAEKLERQVLEIFVELYEVISVPY